MKIFHVFALVWMLSIWGNPSEMVVVKGAAHLQNEGKGILQIGASDGAILNWKDFSVAAGEEVHFVQPHTHAWVLNQVTGKGRTEIFGRLESNGQVVLVNPQGILFARDCVIDVGGIIASSLGDVVHEGTLTAQSGSIGLLGKTVRVSGSLLSRVGKHAYIRAEKNPFGLQFQKGGERVFICSQETTAITEEGFIQGETVFLSSEGITYFHGKGDVGDIEISGKEGFYHSGEIKRTGSLLLDPESEVTISALPSYNYSMGVGPTADMSNISIETLIAELNQGPVTITTSYQGEGGRAASIVLTADVNHTYNSPFSLTLQTVGEKGIQVWGNLTNTGLGSIDLSAPTVTIEGQLVANTFNIQGNLLCVGELYGKHFNIFSKGDSVISGRLMVDGGNLYWHAGGDILLQGGEWGHLGTGKLMIDGVRNFLIEEGSHLYGTSRTTEMTIQNLAEIFSIEKGRVSGGNGPLTISGEKGAVSLSQGTLSSLSSITIDVGHYLHLDESHLFSQKPMDISLGSDLLLMRGSTLSSSAGIHFDGAGDLALIDTSSISGKGLHLIAGDNISLVGSASIRGGETPLFIMAGKNLSLEGPQALIEAGQVSIHAGNILTLSGDAAISSLIGNASVTAENMIRLDGNGTITARGGDLNLVVSRGNLYLYGTSTLLSETHGMEVKTGHSVIAENFSQIKSFGDAGTTIVVDQLSSDGGMILGTNAAITTGDSPLKIFSTKRDLNSIEGTLNGYRYVTTPLYLRTEMEQWGTSYPHAELAFPFTVFHQENGLVQTKGGTISSVDFSRIAINFAGPFTAEMQRTLHPYDEFTEQTISFTDGETYYWIRTPTYRWQKATPLIRKPLCED